jgi:hypothetical protein
MATDSFSRAVLCRPRGLRVTAILIALSGCGGAVASTSNGGPAADVSSTSPGCPSTSEIDGEAAVGQACAPEGTYCLNPACDACNMHCPAVSCTHGVWTPAVNTALCTSKPDAGPGIDATPDGGACIDLDPRSFDQTCSGDSDCVEVTGGTFCAGASWCTCGGESINVDDKSRYDTAFKNIQSTLTPGPGGCFCPYLGSPRCAAGHCTLCGGPGGSPNDGCPDGG